VYFQADDRLDPRDVARRALACIELPSILPSGRKFLIPGEVKYGRNWETCKKNPETKVITNPNGLIKIKL
jgi:hypothetical protein